MQSNQNSDVPPGWVGGFAESNPAFAYPHPDLNSLPMLDNMDNIDLLQRQQGVEWPEFSWETIPGQPDSRCFQMFAPFISRIGYTDSGRIYSIICPQQGFSSPSLGNLNIEVTVTGQRGWADETNREFAASLSIEPKIWLSPSAKEKSLVKLLWHIFKRSNLPFPSDKAHAIRFPTYNIDSPGQIIAPARIGETDLFESPDFAKHPEAWAVGNIVVRIGAVIKTGSAIVDDFNTLLMDAFNLIAGNIVKEGNPLSWNVWFTAPELVDREEWRTHAERWRISLDADHGSPDGPGTKPRYHDGTRFFPGEEILQEEHEKILAFLKKHL